jgi:predicted transcriptional regulator
MSKTAKLVTVKVRIKPSLKNYLRQLAKRQKWSMNKSVENAIECAVTREFMLIGAEDSAKRRKGERKP